MKERKRNLIKVIVILGISYPVLAFMFFPIGMIFAGCLLDYFPVNSTLMAKVCWYIYFAPCLISFGVTKLLVSTEFTFFRIVTFFTTQILVYYSIGWIAARVIYPSKIPRSEALKD